MKKINEDYRKHASCIKNKKKNVTISLHYVRLLYSTIEVLK